MLLAPGQTLNGRYQIIQELAQGGFGATFLAEDLHLPEHPRCVVKQLRPPTTEPTTLTTARRLFETEAQILHQLGKHDRIPQLFAYFEEQQEFYLVEAYIEGHSLREEIRQRGKFTEEQAIAVLKEILEILVFVHGNQVIHRDLNPSNLIRRAKDKKLCLIDFGAVKRVTTGFVQSSGGATVAIGTQGYIPSEQAQGRPQFGSDLYAAGMTAIEALTGQFPHTLAADPHTAEIIWRDLVDISDGFGQILEKMIRHDFRERFFSAQAALDAIKELETAEESQTVVLRPAQGTVTPPGNNGSNGGNRANNTNNGGNTTGATGITQVAANLATHLPTALPLQIAPGQRSAKAIAISLGVVAVVSLGVSINLGFQWWAGRQETAQQYDQAQVFQELDKFEEALAAYQEVLGANPDHGGALLGKAQVLQELQRYDEALATYDQVLQINPNAWEAWWGRGKIFSDRQQYDQALAALDKAIQGNSRSAEIWQTKARIHLAQKDTDEALASLDQLLRLDSEQAWAWYEKGWIHHQREQYREAIAAYDRAVRINSTDPNIWYQRGNSYFKLPNYREAANSYRKVVELKPDHAPAWYSLGIAQENLKQYREAQPSFAKVTALEPNNDRAWYHVAWNAQQNGDRPTAIKAYQKTVQLNSGDQASWLNLANLLYEAENYTEAVPAYDQVLAANPGDGDSWQRKGNAHNYLGEYEQAIAAYDEALKYKPNDPEIVANREEAQSKLEWKQKQEEVIEKTEEIKDGLRRVIPVPWR